MGQDRPMDWDKLRIFHAAAEAGSFTHAAETLHLSQSAVSRQVSALEQELGAPLFHRHARGLSLTEQGELLRKTAEDVLVKLNSVESMLADTLSEPSGELRITTPAGLGSTWLAPRLPEFIERYPKIQIQLLLRDEELDLSKREADVGIWLSAPTQKDLILRRLFTVHFHVYGAKSYLERRGTPEAITDLDHHAIITYGGIPFPRRGINWLETAGREGQPARKPIMRINSMDGIKRVVKRSMGLAVLPDYLASDEPDLCKVLNEADVPAFNTYLVYPAELKNSKRVAAFRDFVVAKAREWAF